MGGDNEVGINIGVRKKIRLARVGPGMIRGKKKFCDWGSDKEVGNRRNIFDMEGARTSVKGCNQVHTKS